MESDRLDDTLNFPNIQGSALRFVAARRYGTENLVDTENHIASNTDIDSQRRLGGDSLSSIPFKFNPEESAFRLIDNNSSRSNWNDKPFSVTPGPINILGKEVDGGENTFLLSSPSTFSLFSEHNQDRNIFDINVKTAVSRSPDVFGIVSQVLNSQSPANDKGIKFSLHSNTNRLSMSPTSDLPEQLCKALFHNETPATDEAIRIQNRQQRQREIEESDLVNRMKLQATISQPYYNAEIKYSDLSSSAKPWTGSTIPVMAAQQIHSNDSLAQIDLAVSALSNGINPVEYVSSGYNLSTHELGRRYDYRRTLFGDDIIQENDDSLRLPKLSVEPSWENKQIKQNSSLSHSVPGPTLVQTRESAELIRPKPSQERVLSTNSRQSQRVKTVNSTNTLVSSVDSDASLTSKRIGGLSLDLKASVDSSKTSSSVGKHDFVESPRSKTAFKEFSNSFRAKCKISNEEAELFALDSIPKMPEHAKWRVYIELAELAKKKNDAETAREYYIKACSFERRASAIWLEWSKMEEENGQPVVALRILTLGIMICKMNESLLPRLIKLHERLHAVEKIRGVLSALKYESIDRAWKSILEGSLFEARAGNFDVSRRIFKYLMKHVPWYGPIYFEAFRLEERENRDEAALAIIRKGLSELPRYGPLWFGLIRIMERRDILKEKRLWQQGQPPLLCYVNAECTEAVKSISKELTWRVHYERFLTEERAAEIAAVGLFNSTNHLTLLKCRDKMLGICRKSLTQSLLLCPNNLRWRLFLVGARLELGLGYVDRARRLVSRAYSEVPAKSKASVVIESSRLEEHIGNLSLARKILRSSMLDLQNDWRAHLESILLEARNGCIPAAIALAKQAVALHSGTGRIWALLIQLNHIVESVKVESHQRLWSSFDQALLSSKEIIIRHAISEVPKSGEVWCEQGRCRLNPLLVHDFDLALAQQSFGFAIQFTPQYGDTFVEYLRLEILCGTFLRFVCENLGVNHARLVNCYLSHDADCDLVILCLPSQDAKPVHRHRSMVASKRAEFVKNLSEERLSFSEVLKDLRDSTISQFPNLLRRCINADPNYGTLWFHCRELPYDIPSEILTNALHKLVHEFLSSSSLYLKAILEFVRKTIQKDCDRFKQRDTLQARASSDSESPLLTASLEELQWHADILQDISVATGGHSDSEIQSSAGGNMNSSVGTTHSTTEVVSVLPLLHRVSNGDCFCVQDFITALVEVNRGIYNPHNDEEVRRKFLFGIDQIV